MTISNERLAEMVGAGVPCVPAQPGEIAAVVQELRRLRSDWLVDHLTACQQEVNEDALRALAQAYDREDAAQRGEPDPWNLDDPGDIGDSDTWVSERFACARAAAEALLSTLTAALPHMGGVEIKPLEWMDADEGTCTKWRAAALGGHYELVSFDKEPGLAVNFHWGRPLSFWFIQGEPDEWGPTGPKIFPTLEEAKAAAQADYERRILSTLTEHIDGDVLNSAGKSNTSAGPGGPEEYLAAEILSELVRARTKFPGKNVTFAALVEEVGELATATFEESRDRVRKEAVQVAVMAMRMVLDGDHTFDDWRASKGLDPLVALSSTSTGEPHNGREVE